MAAVFTTTDSWHDSKRLHVVGTLALSGTYPAAGGEILNLAGVKGVLSSLPPVWGMIKGISGFMYEWLVGTTIANGAVKVRVNTTPGVNSPFPEHTNVAYVAGVTGDSINFHFIFKLR